MKDETKPKTAEGILLENWRKTLSDNTHTLDYTHLFTKGSIEAMKEYARSVAQQVRKDCASTTAAEVWDVSNRNTGKTEAAFQKILSVDIDQFLR